MHVFVCVCVCAYLMRMCVCVYVRRLNKTYLKYSKCRPPSLRTISTLKMISKANLNASKMTSSRSLGTMFGLFIASV